MIAAALTSPCLIRSDVRTITIEKLQFIECADGRFSAGVAGIPLRHANLSGTDQRSGSREAPVSLPRRSAGGDLNRSEERRVGKECGRTGSSRWSPYH